MSLPPLIRPFEPSDVTRVLEIQSASPEASQWSAADYVRTTENSCCGLVAVDREVVVGFAICRITSDELEILNIGVHPAHRRHGIASQLLSSILDQARTSGTKTCFLEVRHTNSAAISFYLRHGFSRAGRRPSYYSHPPGDALLLSLPL